MKFKIIFFVSLVAMLTLSSAYFVQAPKPYRAFSISMPSLVEASPGDLVTINGTILNFGQWWLHNFNLTASGLPAEYNVTFYPSWFEHLRILRGWDPEKGVYLIPEKFVMTIKVPKDSTGIFTVNVTGQEFTSWKKISNSTIFIFRVTSPAPPKLSITDIVVPENVSEFEPFNITFDVKNEGLIDQPANLSVIVPSGWSVEPALKVITIKANESESLVFTITPSNTSGEISVLMLYPYKTEILNITKVGPFLVPKAPVVTPEVPTGLFAWLEKAIVQLRAIPSWILVVAIVFLAIFIWYISKILKGYRFKIVRKKPEEMKKQVELAKNNISQNL